MKKHCAGCSNDLEEEYFSFKDIKRGVRHSTCKECKKAYSRKHYRDHKSNYIAQALRRNKQRRLQGRATIVEYLLHHPCTDCGEKDIRCLEFDHVRPGKKRDIAVMLNHGYSLNTIMQEIDLCEVRCANCHRKRTSTQLGFWSALHAETNQVGIAQWTEQQLADM